MEISNANYDIQKLKEFDEEMNLLINQNEIIEPRDVIMDENNQ